MRITIRFWAANSTGHGDKMAQVCLCHYITMLMRQGLTVQESTKKRLQYMAGRVDGSVAQIDVDECYID